MLRGTGNGRPVHRTSRPNLPPNCRSCYYIPPWLDGGTIPLMRM